VDLPVQPPGGLFNQIGRHASLESCEGQDVGAGDAEMLRNLRLLVGEGADDPSRTRRWRVPGVTPPDARGSPSVAWSRLA